MKRLVSESVLGRGTVQAVTAHLQVGDLVVGANAAPELTSKAES